MSCPLFWTVTSLGVLVSPCMGLCVVCVAFCFVDPRWRRVCFALCWHSFEVPRQLLYPFVGCWRLSSFDCGWITRLCSRWWSPCGAIVGFEVLMVWSLGIIFLHSCQWFSSFDCWLIILCVLCRDCLCSQFYLTTIPSRVGLGGSIGKPSVGAFVCVEGYILLVLGDSVFTVGALDCDSI